MSRGRLEVASPKTSAQGSGGMLAFAAQTSPARLSGALNPVDAKSPKGDPKPRAHSSKNLRKGAYFVGSAGVSMRNQVPDARLDVVERLLGEVRSSARRARATRG